MRENTRLLLRLARLLRTQADVLDSAGLLPDPRQRLRDERTGEAVARPAASEWISGRHPKERSINNDDN